MSGEAKPLKGVNLGGWLVLEKWITPSLFAGLKAQDEFGFCHELGDETQKKLNHHRSSFITEADFKWLAEQGLEAIRLPVGYWSFGGYEPFVNCIDFVDFAFEQAERLKMKVILDLHSAPGSQNGFDHSGRAGPVNWHKDKANIDVTLEILAKLCERYGRQPGLIGIELLNEPAWEIPLKVLRIFYRRGYEIVRALAGPKISVIISDGFRPDQWSGVMPEKDYKNLIFDMHLYQLFTPQDQALSLKGHIDKALNEWQAKISNMQQSNPVIVGEWSAEMNYKPEKNIPATAAAARYAQAQIAAFQIANGWFFWTYKTESRSFWSLRDCVPGVFNLK
jgi:glucan 1,3-beta-glucosidase